MSDTPQSDLPEPCHRSDNDGHRFISDDTGDIDWTRAFQESAHGEQYDYDFAEDKGIMMHDKINYSVGVSMGSIHSMAYQKTILEKTNLTQECYSRIICIETGGKTCVNYLKDKFEELKDVVGENHFTFDFVNRQGKIADLEMVYDHMRIYYRERDEKGNPVLCIGCDTPERLSACLQHLDLRHSIQQSTRWYFISDDGCLASAEGNIKPAKDCTKLHVPWVNEEVDSFLDSYEASESPILILIGPPGTGKTSLINHYVHKYGKKSAVTYDNGVLAKDSFFIQYITDSDQNLLILEDADDIILRRTDRSRVLSKILNVGDGIVDTSNKKIIITANIDNVENIDPAISRKGRCFAVLTSRAHTPEEAHELAENLGLEKKFEKDITLAEMFNGRNPQLNPQRKVGFGFHD